jgi:hypothetical protein
MGNENKPKHVVLQEFTKILYEHNPMSLPLSQMGEAGHDEYESEALSILSRFTEGVLSACEDEPLRREIAVGMVIQALKFWFNTERFKEPEKLAWALLDAYLAGYPAPEQKTVPVVDSEP